jgi:hypothetical protein
MPQHVGSRTVAMLLILVGGMALIPSASDSQLLQAGYPPLAGGLVAGAASGKETQDLKYRITANDKDTANNNQQVGDPFVELFDGYAGTSAPSGKQIIRAQAGYDATTAFRAYDITVRLKYLSILNPQPQTVVDPYFAGDTQPDTSVFHDHLANGSKLVTPLDQTVTITLSRGMLTGTVTNATGGQKLSANISWERDGMGPPPEASSNIAISDPTTGKYNFDRVVAGLVRVRASKAGFATQEKTVTVPENGTGTLDFALVPQ